MKILKFSTILRNYIINYVNWYKINIGCLIFLNVSMQKMKCNLLNFCLYYFFIVSYFYH